MARILVVDDEANKGGENSVLATGLRIEHFDVFTARSAETALALLEIEGIDVAILALMMPRTNGLELARQIRRRFPHTRVLLTGAYPLSEGQLARADCAGVGFVALPFPVTDFARFLRTKMLPPSTKHDASLIAGELSNERPLEAERPLSR